MKQTSYILTITTIAALTLGTASAASKKSASPMPSASPAASAAAASSSTTSTSSTTKTAGMGRAIPFRGMATAVDQNAKTFTIAGKTNSRVFKVTDKTTVTKMGAPATMADLTDNTAVTGSYWKQADGTMEAKSVKIGGNGGSTMSSKKKSKKGDDAAAGMSASPSPSASPAKK
ncbi:MAG: hypothetical protein M3Y80_08215 [Verrucomicrobiota bacterium]|nr:hypothetical protein [Verrucomicrobiota bacterium]